MKHTSEQVTALIERLRNTPNWLRDGFVDWKDAVLTHDRSPFKAADMLEDYATLLRERESAKAAMTVPACSCCGRTDTLETKCVDCGEIQTVEAVAPMLASARVPEREALEAIKRLPARPFPDPIAHSWEAFGRAVMGAFTDAKFIAIRALAAAPKPETEE